MHLWRGRDCLIHPRERFLSFCTRLQNTTKLKGCGVGSGALGAYWPWQHDCFHASFIHFITSLEECEGVGEKPCHPETEQQEPYSTFSSPGWMQLASVLQAAFTANNFVR